VRSKVTVSLIFATMEPRRDEITTKVDGNLLLSLMPYVQSRRAFERALDAAASANMQTQEMAVELSGAALSAFPAFDHTNVITISGAQAIQLRFNRVRLRSGNCEDAACGRIYVGDANGKIYEMIEGVHDDYTTVIVPGKTIALRFVATFDHDRTTIYRVTGATTY